MLCSILNTQRKTPMQLDRWVGKAFYTKELAELEKAARPKFESQGDKLMTVGMPGWEKELESMPKQMAAQVMSNYYKKQREKGKPTDG